jgi:hypothetical protein
MSTEEELSDRKRTELHFTHDDAPPATEEERVDLIERNAI